MSTAELRCTTRQAIDTRDASSDHSCDVRKEKKYQSESPFDSLAYMSEEVNQESTLGEPLQLTHTEQDSESGEKCLFHRQWGLVCNIMYVAMWVWGHRCMPQPSICMYSRKALGRGFVYCGGMRVARSLERTCTYVSA